MIGSIEVNGDTNCSSEEAESDQHSRSTAEDFGISVSLSALDQSSDVSCSVQPTAPSSRGEIGRNNDLPLYSSLRHVGVIVTISSINFRWSRRFS